MQIRRLAAVFGLSVLAVSCTGDATSGDGGVRINGLHCELDRFEEATFASEDEPAFSSPEEALKHWQDQGLTWGEREEWANLSQNEISIDGEDLEFEFANPNGWVQLIVKVVNSDTDWRVTGWRACGSPQDSG